MITRTLKTFAALLAAATTLVANPAPPSISIFDHFLQNDLLEVTIETDLTELIENRRTDEYLPAIFTFEDAKREKNKMEITVKPRGKFRRKVCNFPPVMLNFSKGQLEKQGYIRDYDKLKLVTHCIDDKATSKEQVMKEYLAYKLYNEVTGLSYRVQLAKVTYVDVKGKVAKIKRYGFIIEDTDEMANRLGGTECEDCHGIATSDLALRTENRMAVFQFMIGNTDWNLNMIRNIKMVKPYGQGGVIPVPYDFDFAGMVDAPYAIPNASIGQLSIKQRVFQGRTVDKEMFEQTLQYFLTKKGHLLQQVEQFKGLRGESRSDILDYLNTFFRDVELILEGKQPQDTTLQKAIEEGGKAPQTSSDNSLGKK